MSNRKPPFPAGAPVSFHPLYLPPSFPLPCRPVCGRPITRSVSNDWQDPSRGSVDNSQPPEFSTGRRPNQRSPSQPNGQSLEPTISRRAAIAQPSIPKLTILHDHIAVSDVPEVTVPTSEHDDTNGRRRHRSTAFCPARGPDPRRIDRLIGSCCLSRFSARDLAIHPAPSRSPSD